MAKEGSEAPKERVNIVYRPATNMEEEVELPLKLLSIVLAATLYVLVHSDKDAATGVYVKVIYTLPEPKPPASPATAQKR